MKKFYGNLANRIDENKMYCDEIKEGTGVTEYSWSDRRAYEVTKVIDQKHVFIREYDHIKADNNSMSNNWKLISNPNNPEIELVFRYGKWNSAGVVTKESLKKLIMIDKKIYDKVMKDGSARVYHPMNVSFGIADYYYDYEF